MTALDDDTNLSWHPPRKGQPRHRADGPPRTDVTGLTRRTVGAARKSLREAIQGSDTPAGGLSFEPRQSRRAS